MRPRLESGPHVRRTPVEAAPTLAQHGAEVLLKLENLQVTGSFKVRGAINKLATLGGYDRVVAASSGNHGLAVAYGAERFGIAATVFVPEGASPAKIAAMKRRGAEVRVHGDDCVVAEQQARAFADAEGCPYLSPYNDVDVMAGQGTVGIELAEQAQTLDAVVVSLGGGGLISGVGAVLKARFPGVQVIAGIPRTLAGHARVPRSGAHHRCPLSRHAVGRHRGVGWRRARSRSTRARPSSIAPCSSASPPFAKRWSRSSITTTSSSRAQPGLPSPATQRALPISAVRAWRS